MKLTRKSLIVRAAYCDEYFFAFINTTKSMDIPSEISVCILLWMGLFKPPVFLCFLLCAMPVYWISLLLEYVWKQTPTLRRMASAVWMNPCPKVEITETK